MCLELLLDARQHERRGRLPFSRPKRGSFCDLGCGSGVLAIAAAKLGFEPVIAVDSDRAALEQMRHNARLSGISLSRVARVNLRDDPAPEAQTSAANLTRPLLLRLAELMPSPPDALIASGLLDHEVD